MYRFAPANDVWMTQTKYKISHKSKVNVYAQNSMIMNNVAQRYTLTIVVG